MQFVSVFICSLEKEEPEIKAFEEANPTTGSV